MAVVIALSNGKILDRKQNCTSSCRYDTRKSSIRASVYELRTPLDVGIAHHSTLGRVVRTLIGVKTIARECRLATCRLRNTKMTTNAYKILQKQVPSTPYVPK